MSRPTLISALFLFSYTNMVLSAILHFLDSLQRKSFSFSWCALFCMTNALLVLQVEQCFSADVELSTVVETYNGKIQGIRVKNHIEFRGIPFAKPPIGKLRFKSPEKPNSWKNKEPLLVDKFPEYCIQYNVFWNTTEGQEDCLYLNVFTPTLNLNKRTKLPVMVYIHPGGFMFGRGSQFRGDYLMEMENVVVVTFHYRLGSFGFLNTGDKESRGNMGLKDQLLALKWVKENIEHFNGDPEIVTIFGTSAGAASVHYHILSPASKGLFHRAISSSGTALCPWAFQPNPIKNTKKLAKLMECPQENSERLVNCLREKSAEEIAKAHSKFIDWYTDPISAFSPSVETIIEENEIRFLEKEPATIIKSKRVNNVPWLVGFNSEEGYDHSFGIVRNSQLRKELNENWLRISQSTFEYVNKDDSLKDDIAKRIKEFYFNGQSVSKKNLMNLTNAYSDTTFVHCAVQSSLLHANIGENHHVYLYKFGYQGRHSILNLRGFSNTDFGANHMDDLQYTMNSILYPFLEENHPDKNFQKRYLLMLTSFAKYGKIKDPVTHDDLEPLKPSDGIKWYLIDENPKMESCSRDFSSRMKFWDGIHDHDYKFLLKEKPKDEL